MMLRVGSEPFPQLVHQDHDVVFAIHALFGQKIAAELQSVAHHPVHARSSLLTIHHLRRFFARQVKA